MTDGLAQGSDDVVALAREWIARARADMVWELGGHLWERPSGRFADGPVFGERPYAASEPDPILEIKVGRRLELAAGSSVRPAVRMAREQGRSWREIGDALGIRVSPEIPGVPDTVAELAFAYVAGERSGATLMVARSFTWTCAGCGRAIVDYGPGYEVPHEAEPGHGDGCARFAAAVAAWKAARGSGRS